jgi:GntR family transcriptional regulator/MocR family aminotransferase
MGKSVLLTVPLDADADAPLFRQLYEGLRGRILDGTLAAGARLPATRRLAEELGVSRNTVLNAYEQLLAEGYLEGKIGSGTYVPSTLPDDLLRVRPSSRSRQAQPQRRSKLSQRGELLTQAAAPVLRSGETPRPFRPGVPGLDVFPFDLWTRLVSRHHRRPTSDLLAYHHPGGYYPLRRAIASHLGAARAVRCDPEQVIIVTGSQQAIDLIARILLDPGDTAWIEDPGYLGAKATLKALGVQVRPVAVDEAGLNVEIGQERCPDARLVYVSPSHQYPLGVTMSLPRRLALLDWARHADAWVVEDDYDSEFRYAGRPLAALQGLDRDGRVIYVGTFSKALFPSLRLGYLVLPRDLVEAFIAARAVLDRQTPTLTQAVVADFIGEGHFQRHVRRMRTIYRERQDALLEAARRELSEVLEVPPCETGLHLVGWLQNGLKDVEAARSAAQAGVEAPPLSTYYLKECPRDGLLLGYAGSEPQLIRAAVRRLASTLQKNHGGRRPR